LPGGLGWYEFDETIADDLRSLIEHAPVSSLLLVTFNGSEIKYGHANERIERLKQVFGAVVPDDLTKQACRGEHMQETLANFAIDFMQSIAEDLARPGGFVPAFRLIYKDTAPMVTVGGLLPPRGAARTAADLVRDISWPCRPAKPITAPHLTIREATVLQSQLPRPSRLTRDLVRGLGFDLEEGQIEAFETYYRQYPALHPLPTWFSSTFFQDAAGSRSARGKLASGLPRLSKTTRPSRFPIPGISRRQSSY